MKCIPSMVRVSALVSAFGLVAACASAQDTRQLFNAGRYQTVIDNANAQGGALPEPSDNYLLAQAYLRQQNPDGAKNALQKLAERGETDPWSLIARSERARIDQNLDEALPLATAAVAQEPPAPVSAYAFYQLGLVQNQRQNPQAAADAFEKATAIAPDLAYAHYFAGVAYSALKRVDRVATHFDTFLKLAPQAPERPAVESVMTTIRGK